MADSTSAPVPTGPEAASPVPEAVGAQVPAPETPVERNLRDIRREVSARAARPGTTEERLGAERDARSALSRFGQAQVSSERVYGGDHIEVTLGRGQHSVRAYQLSAQEIDLARSVFLPPARYSALLRESDPFAVVLLSGAPGSGRYAAAQRLLLDRGHTTLQCLEPDADLTRLDDASLRDGHGYLLPDFPLTVGSTALTGFEIQRLNTLMRARGCRLVLTLRDDVRTADPELDKHTFPVGSPPAPRAVFEGHLRWWLGPGRASRASRLLDSPEVAALIPGRGASASSLGKAAESARLLSETSGAPPDAAQQVSARLTLRETQEFEGWFSDLADLPTQCLALAIAVFGGEGYETVSALAFSLGRQLQPAPTPDYPDRPRNEAIVATRAVRLSRLNASLVTEQVASRHGGAPAKVVRFLDPQMAGRVLQCVWEEYDIFRQELPGWLKNCAGHELATVRARSAVAVGFLSGLSFDSLRVGVLRPWAASALPRLREAAATALGVATDQPELNEPVRDLVRAWAADSGNAQLRATSARAWAALVRPEEENGGEAVALLNTLAGTDQPQVIEAVCTGITEALSTQNRHHQRNALALIGHWTSQHDPQRRTVGELAFLFAAADLLEELPAGPAGGMPRRWPKLLALAARDPMRQRDIARLWETVLLSPAPYQAAAEVLTEWARMVDMDPAGRRALGRLLHGAASSARSRSIILRHVSTWCSSDSRAHRTAQHVLSHFDSEGAAR